MRKIKAFTLVELIIVIAIVAIISAVSWSVLGGAKKSAAVNDACNQVATMINKTRNYALSGKQVNGVVPDSFRIKTGGPVVIYSVTSSGETQMESFSLAGGISCGSYIFTYNVPDGVSGIEEEEVFCTDADIDAIRTVNVTPYVATCQ